MLHLQDPLQENLSQAGATQGFILSNDDGVQLFFHWVADDKEGTHLNDILQELRPRLEAMGFVSDVEDIQKQVTDKYGKGS